jgi:hypothetical protein
VGSGAAFVLASVVVLFIGSLWFNAITEFVDGRLAFVIPGAPLTVVALLVGGFIWTRKLLASGVEAVAVFVVAEALIVGAWMFVVGSSADELLLVFVASLLLVAPWWFLGHMIGVATGPDRRRPENQPITRP